MTRVVYWTLMILAPAVFLFSLFLDVFPKWPGYGALLFGWLLPWGVFQFGPIALSWLANPAFAFAWVCSARGRNREAVMCAIWAIGLGLCFVLGGAIPADEGGAKHFTSEQRGAAYSYWMLSFLLVLAAAFWRRQLMEQPKTNGAVRRGSTGHAP